MSSKSISDMTANSCVFLTGATGFVGGCLLERILKLDPGPARVFILMRKKNGVEPQLRLKEMFLSPLYSNIPAEKFERCLAMEGDICSTAEDLGLSNKDVELLVKSCTHVYHSAAFISFAAQLDQAIKSNLRGTWSVLKLAKKMKNLKAMVHVSTAFCNSTIGTEFTEIQEVIYPAGVDPLEILTAVDKMSLNELKTKYADSINRHPNTYSFSKQLTENLIAQERGNLPLTIVRPSVILNSWRQPFPGWADNINSGACAYIAGAGKGIFYSIQANPDMIFDVIPIDLVISTILAGALKAEKEPKNLHVMHCTSSKGNPTTWSQYCSGITNAAREHPCKLAAWYPRSYCRESTLRHNLVIFIFQIIPAVFLDLLSPLIKPGHSIMDVQRRYIKGNNYTSYFALREWYFVRKNADDFYSQLTEEERVQHPMDPRLINWDSYFESCVIGTRRYFHKEPAETTKSARKHMDRMRIIAILSPAIFFVIFYLCLGSLIGLTRINSVLLSAFLIAFLVWL